MSDSKGNAVQHLQAFIDGYLESLQQQPEEDILGAPQTGAPERARFAEIVQAARQEAGKRRLQAARRALDRRTMVPAVEEPIDVGEARRVIAEAVNNPRFTLAARDLKEMSDDDVLRIYRQLRELGISPTDEPQ